MLSGSMGGMGGMISLVSFGLPTVLVICWDCRDLRTTGIMPPMPPCPLGPCADAMGPTSPLSPGPGSDAVAIIIRYIKTGEIDSAGATVLGSHHGYRDIALFLSQYELCDRYWALIQYPGYTIEWQNKKLSRRAAFPVDPTKVALVDSILVAMGGWEPGATAEVIAQVKVGSGISMPESLRDPLWVGAAPRPANISLRSINYSVAAKKVDLAQLLGLPSHGGKIRCPAHDDERPSMSIYWDGNSERWRYRCWSCGVHGDALDFIANVKGISVAEAACVALHGSLPRAVLLTPRADPKRTPVWQLESWQATVAALVDVAAEVLVEPGHYYVMQYLRDRGLTDQTIKRFHLGFMPKPITIDDIDGFPDGIYVPRGVVIPWAFPGHGYHEVYTSVPIHAGFNVRRLGWMGDISFPPRKRDGTFVEKYLSARGSTRIFPYPYAEVKYPSAPMVILEGEFDAMLAYQMLGDRFNVLTYAYSTADPGGLYIPPGVLAVPKWFLLFDNDAAGRQAVVRWHKLKPDAIPVPYPGKIKDFTDLVAHPKQYNDWVAALENL